MFFIVTVMSSAVLAAERPAPSVMAEGAAEAGAAETAEKPAGTEETATAMRGAAAPAVMGDWRGKVVDESGEPVAYANVAVLAKADSTVLCGTVTEEDGTFYISTREPDGIMMVAILGYRTQYLALDSGTATEAGKAAAATDSGTAAEMAATANAVEPLLITLKADTEMLEGATVQAVMPVSKLTGEGVQTTVRGSVLENAGSANDVLEKTPGLIKSQDGLEVIGKGAPVVYINGHKVSDSSELDRLQSNEIQSVEVITNPGAQYDATVRSVVRIKTIRRQGDGFSFSVNALDSQSLRWKKGNTVNGAFNANYRTGGVDIFAGVNYHRWTGRQQSYLEKATFGNNLFENKGDLLNEYVGSSVYGNAGVNWQISEDHFIGGKMEWGTRLGNNVHTVVNDNVFENGVEIDRLSTSSNDRIGSVRPYNLGANVYYNGLVAKKFGIDINFDYYGSTDSSLSTSDETSEMSTDAAIRSESRGTTRMYAAKAVFSYPVWKGQLQFGTEETFSRRSDNYTIEGVDFPASQAKIKEDDYAAFATYGFEVPKFGQLSAGIRFEHVRYIYEDALNPENNIYRKYNNWFPTASYSTRINAGKAGPVQLMVNYSAKTLRPGYANLSGAIRYNSRYLWQSGNARLQPERSHDVSFMAMWKFITLSVNYSRTDAAITMWSAPYGDEGVVLVKPDNLPNPVRAMSIYANFRPTIGPWTMNYTVGVKPQWLTINAPDPREESGIRQTKFNGKPIFFAQVFDTFKVKGGWQFEVGWTLQSRGYMQNLYMKSIYFNLEAAIQKTLLKDGSLVLRLEGRDLAGTAHFDIDTDFGSHTIKQTNRMDTQWIRFSIRYNFNAAQSKYRGTGAGADARARM